jgi:hypothetical protein
MGWEVWLKRRRRGGVCACGQGKMAVAVTVIVVCVGSLLLSSRDLPDIHDKLDILSTGWLSEINKI